MGDTQEISTRLLWLGFGVASVIACSREADDTADHLVDTGTSGSTDMDTDADTDTDADADTDIDTDADTGTGTDTLSNSGVDTDTSDNPVISNLTCEDNPNSEIACFLTWTTDIPASSAA